MNNYHVIAIDINGLLLEINNKFNTYKDLLQYLHNHWKQLKDQKLYTVEYQDDVAISGTFYKYNLDSFYSCEDGIYYSEQFDEIDQGLGIKEIGTIYLVNNDLVPKNLDTENVELEIEKYINKFYTNSTPEKPSWLI